MATLEGNLADPQANLEIDDFSLTYQSPAKRVPYSRRHQLYYWRGKQQYNATLLFYPSLPDREIDNTVSAVQAWPTEMTTLSLQVASKAQMH